MNNKEEYIREVEKQMAEWQSDIYKLRVVAEDAGWEDPDRQINYYQVIEELTAKENEVTDKLSLLKDLTEGDWHANKDEIEGLRKELAEAVAKARSSVT